MGVKWHVRRNFRDYGPFSGGQIRKLATQGKLNLDDFLWSGRPEDGAPARHYQGVDEMISEAKAPKTGTAVATPPAGTPKPRVTPAPKAVRKG